MIWADHSFGGILQSVVGLNVCDGEASIMKRPWPSKGCCVMGKKNTR